MPASMQSKTLVAATACAVSVIAASAQAATGVGPYYATPSWDQTLPASTRFIVLTNMNSEAVLDRETGLVWEQSPDATFRTWFSAMSQCANLTKGGRRGWRLPGVQELNSLIDPTVASPGPMLPVGHPFNNVQQNVYWTSTVSASVPNAARIVYLNEGLTGVTADLLPLLVWCVRGGQGPDVQ